MQKITVVKVFVFDKNLDEILEHKVLNWNDPKLFKVF